MRLFILAAYAIASLSGAAALYEQCGGIGFSGSTSCTNGGCCTYSNPYYSQCLPCSSTPSPSTTPVTSTKSTTSPSSTHVTTSTTSVPTVSKTTTTSTTSTKATTTTSSGPAPSGTQIRSDQDPTFHFYLQNDAGSAVLGPVGSSGYFVFESDGSLLLSGTGLYLNLANTSSTYKELTFGSTPNFYGWTLEGDTVITSTSSTYGRQLNFLTCTTSDPTVYSVYLELSSDVPPDQTCSQYISLHLPCLC